MLPSTSPREAVLACPTSPSRNLPSFTVESTLCCPCSCSDLPLSPPYDLVLWRDSSISFPFGKGGSGVLADCSLCGTEATLSFSAGPVCSSFFAEACAILHALCWSRQHQQACHFSYFALVLSSPPCPLLLLSFYLNLFGRSGRNCLLSPPVLSGYNGCPDTRFSRGTMRLMSWSDGERYLHLMQSFLVSLLSLVFTLVFSWIGGILSHRNFSTRRFPRFPPRNLCSLVTLVVCSCIFAATDTAFC